MDKLRLVGKWMEGRWDAVAAYGRRHPRKSAVLGFLLFVLPVQDIIAGLWASRPSLSSIMTIPELSGWDVVVRGIGGALLVWVFVSTRHHKGGVFATQPWELTHAQRAFQADVRDRIIEKLTEPASDPRDEEIARLRGSIDVMADRAKRLQDERDGALQALANTKQAFARARLRWFADGVRDRDPKVRVTIRFADYKDLPLVQAIEKELKETTDWPVHRDGGNNPALMPDSEFKVIFESGITRTFDNVAWAFSDGLLQPETKVGARGAERSLDLEHLVIEVLPTVT